MQQRPHPATTPFYLLFIASLFSHLDTIDCITFLPKTPISTMNSLISSCCGIFGTSTIPNSEELETPPMSSLLNSAIVFIKPHANTNAVQTLVKDALESSAPSMKILSETVITGSEIDSKKLIDQHYYAIASKATILTPKDISPMVPRDKFEGFFDEAWDDVLTDGRVANAIQACESFECSADELSKIWRDAEGKGKVLKMGGGFYCGLLQNPSKESQSLYVMNAFFMEMRGKFVAPESSIVCYEIQWDPLHLSWSDFRNKLLGPTDPVKAPKGSIRNRIYREYKKLGLSSEPDKGNNAVHASASPFEGLAEKTNWLGKSIEKDEFGSACIKDGKMKRKMLVDFCKDPQVQLSSDGSKGSLFDALEDLDASECYVKLMEIKELQ